jgi:hypothetical protein
VKRDRPGGESVEHRDENNREIGGARNGSLRILCFVSKDSARLEADEGADNKDQCDAETGRENRPWSEGSDGNALRSASRNKDGDPEQEQDRDLGRHAESEDLAAELDAPDSAEDDCGSQNRRVDEPVDIGTAGRLHDAIREQAEKGVDPDVDRVVGGERNESGRNTRRTAKTVCDVGIKTTGASDVPVHRGEPDAENEIEETNEKKCTRHARSIAEGEGRGRRADDGRQRRGGRDDKEHDVGDADCIAS